MESDILDALEQVGYGGVLVNENALSAACEHGCSSQEYANMCAWLSTKLNHHCDIGNQRSGTSDDPERVFLVSELQAAQIMASKTVTDRTVKKQITPLQDLQAICKTLNLTKPDEQRPSELFSSIENQVNVLLKKFPERHVGKPVLKQSLTSEQWRHLEKINHVLSADYACRRRMLAKRLDVTVQSFSWTDRAKEKIDAMAKAYQPKRHSLTLKSSVSLAHLLAAREDICNMVKTSSGSSREKTTCAVNRVLMGRVPDRGGRPSEIGPPPPEMPPWQKRQDGGGRGGSRGGGYGGGGYGGGGRYGRGGGYGGGYGGGGSKGGWGQGGGGGRGQWGKGGKGGYYR
ncbi:protein FAM98B isoform X2 [Electrophorus electricus]|uniref:protein FAM98B isoform X2 n=1 Tax=Electrophorus electricus TaxID=8005 RepID=UPI000F0A1B7C|nr:protein FAM98B isoform X2 [Electrophorus electricus]